MSDNIQIARHNDHKIDISKENNQNHIKHKGNSLKEQGLSTKKDAKIGSLSVRLAQNEEEIHRAQKLRYNIFIAEKGGQPNEEQKKFLKDFDQFDQYCDHLLVIDNKLSEDDKVIGTYRLLRRSVAVKNNIELYTQSEYDLSKLKNFSGEILEVGRSCVAPKYRTGATILLLWRGIVNYCINNDVALLVGCASFDGTDIDKHALALSYLYHNHLAPEDFCPRALDKFFYDMNIIAKDEIDNKLAISALPPLVKGYLQNGSMFGDGAVIDHIFKTTDVCVYFPLERIISGRFHRRQKANSDNEN